MLAGLFKTSPSKSPGSPTRSTKQASRSVYHHGYAPSASAGLTLASRPRPIEVAASVALSPAGPSRSRGLSQWAIELSSPPRVADACEDGGKPPEPVPSSEKRPAASHGRMVEGLAMLANSDRLMPWVRHMEIGPGRFYTGFLDEQGLPDIFGFIQYFGHDIGAALDASEHVFGLHVRAHFESRSSLDGRNFIQTARHDVRAVSSLPSVVTHVVHRPAASTQGSLAVYIGEMRQGRRHGLGRIKFHSGNEYAGTWNHDQPQGVGVERRADRSRHYGHFSRWQCHGYGLAIEGQNEGPGFRTTEGLFADGKVDICAVGGRMQTERFLISRDEFWTRHRSDAFDPGNDRHIDLVRAVDSVFQKALEAERGANVMANLTLHLDQTCARLAKPALHQPGLGAGPGMREGDLDDRVQNFCSRSFDESAALKLSWSDLLAASAYTELVFGSLLSQLCRVAGDFAATGPGSCSRAVGLEAVSWASKNSDQSNAAVHLFLHEKFEVLSSTQPLLLAFERQLCRELATALAVSLDRLTILASNPSTTAPPAVTVVLLILSDTSGPTPAAIANRLQAQVSSADSCLKTGTYTRNLFRCKDLGCTSHRDGAPPPYERAYQVQPGHFPWHSTPHSDQDNFPIYDISTISTFHRQPSDGESAFRGSSSSFTPSKYEVSSADGVFTSQERFLSSLLERLRGCLWGNILRAVPAKIRIWEKYQQQHVFRS